MKKKLLSFLLPLLALSASAQKPEDAEKFASLVTADGLKEKLTILAGAEMEGRETASPGQKRAAAYIEEQFKKMGLKPGNGDSYQQVFTVYQDVLSDKKLMVNGKTFTWDQDYSFSMAMISSGSWNYNSVVYAGNGVVDSAAKINDYAGLDVKGKLVIITDAGGAAGNNRGMSSSSMNKINAARSRGAAGILVVTGDFPRKNPTQVKGRMSIKAPATSNANANNFLVATISPEVAAAAIGRVGAVSAAQWKEIPNGTYISEIKIAAQKTTEALESSNVIGIIPGTDRKDEYLFITGHYDHLGRVGDVIWYGADDDGSGTVSVMQMAEAFAAAAKKHKGPRRTIAFMTVSGEEKGLLGSEYYSDHPIYPLDKTTANLNIDMVGRVDTERKMADTLNYVYVIGHDKLSSELPIINEGVNKKYTGLTLDYKFDDPNDKNRIYYRSDHYNFARKGVPILFFYDGMLLADYHKPTDTVDKINFPLMEKRAKMIFHTGWEMANRDDMLKRDTPLNMPGR
ncbi:MAG: M28 family peptidase [Chitinophagia bacterium]|nr:M28 family peptidase [Chitinophagia bacterium]